MGAMTSQITSLTIVYSTVYSRRRSKKTSKLRVIGLWADNFPVTDEFPAQMASNAENVSILWRHHGCRSPGANIGTEPSAQPKCILDKNDGRIDYATYLSFYCRQTKITPRSRRSPIHGFLCCGRACLFNVITLEVFVATQQRKTPVRLQLLAVTDNNPVVLDDLMRHIVFIIDKLSTEQKAIFSKAFLGVLLYKGILSTCVLGTEQTTSR